MSSNTASRLPRSTSWPRGRGPPENASARRSGRDKTRQHDGIATFSCFFFFHFKKKKEFPWSFSSKKWSILPTRNGQSGGSQITTTKTLLLLLLFFHVCAHRDKIGTRKRPRVCAFSAVAFCVTTREARQTTTTKTSTGSEHPTKKKRVGPPKTGDTKVGRKKSSLHRANKAH